MVLDELDELDQLVDIAAHSWSSVAHHHVMVSLLIEHLKQIVLLITWMAGWD